MTPPVTCPNLDCRSTRTRVLKTKRTGGRTRIGPTIRHRLCLSCGREWDTTTPPAIETFLRNRPSLRKKQAV